MIFRLHIDTANAAFNGALEDVSVEIALIVGKALAQLAAEGETGGNCLDRNGNTVGHWTYTADPEPEIVPLFEAGHFHHRERT
jgi:hypothetical protein